MLCHTNPGTKGLRAANATWHPKAPGATVMPAMGLLGRLQGVSHGSGNSLSTKHSIEKEAGKHARQLVRAKVAVRSAAKWLCDPNMPRMLTRNQISPV